MRYIKWNKVQENELHEKDDRDIELQDITCYMAEDGPSILHGYMMKWGEKGGNKFFHGM